MCVLDGPEKKQDCIVAVILKDDRSFSSYNLNQKRDIITNGPPKPKELPFLVTKKTVNRPNGKKESYNCKFRSNLYDKHDWMCACSADEKTTGGLFCWPCLLFNNNPSVRTWKAAPFRDMNNVTNEAKATYESAIPPACCSRINKFWQLAKNRSDVGPSAREGDLNAQPKCNDKKIFLAKYFS